MIGEDLIGPIDRTTEEDRHIDNNFKVLLFFIIKMS